MGYSTGRWDISNLAGKNGPEAQMRKMRRDAAAFEGKRKGLAHNMSRKKFGMMLRRLERISEETSIISSYASLAYAADTQSDKAAALLARISRAGADVSNRALYFGLWWKGLNGADAARLSRGENLDGYLGAMRRSARYMLAEPVERAINTLDATGATALARLYDRITGAYKYRIVRGGRRHDVTREEISALVKDRSGARRKAAYVEMLSVFEGGAGVTGDIYRNIVLNWRDEHVGMRGYSSPISARNSANDIDDRTVRSLLDACKEGAPVFGRYFALKARMLGEKRLRRYDLYAPASRHGKKYPYDIAVREVLGALYDFSPELGGLARGMFEAGHVDSEVRQGKRDGAFCSSPSPRITPYVMLSYTGTVRDVFTLAHETGHAIHAMAARNMSPLVHDAPLPIAETASTFAELLLYDRLSGNMTGACRRAATYERLDDLYATIQRQAFFTMFESEAHKMIADGATTKEVSGAYMRGLQKQLGRSVGISGDFGSEWVGIPHFYHAPFYCYAYSFGNLLALSLYRRYVREGRDFVPSYMEILSAGGSEKPEDLLGRHGIRIGSAGFWREGVRYVDGLVKELSKL